MFLKDRNSEIYKTHVVCIKMVLYIKTILGLTLYASDLRAKRSFVVLTGANRSLGTTTAPASSKHSMADPIAVSNWNTAGVLESLGFTVFLFFIRGSLSTPPDASRVACWQKKTLESSVFEQSRQTRLVSNWLVFVCKIYVLDYYSWIGSISVWLCDVIVYRMKSSYLGWIRYQR